MLTSEIHQIALKVKEVMTPETLNQEEDATNWNLPTDHLQKILDLSLDIICTVDSDGKLGTISAASKLILDYSPEELYGKRVLDLVHPDDQEKAQSAFSNLKNGIDIVNLEFCCLRKSGSAITLLWSARWDDENKLAYGIAKDISALKRVEDQLRKKELRFRSLMQNSVEGLVLANADGTITELSPSARKAIGFQENEPLERIRFDLIHPEDLEETYKAWGKVKSQPFEFVRVEFRFLIPDRGYRWLETTVHNQLDDPNVGGLVLNFRDIHDRKMTELALQKSEASLKEAQAMGHIGSWEINLATGSIAWSDEVYQIYGVERINYTPSFETFISFIHPEDRAEVVQKMNNGMAVLETGKMDFRILRPSGEVRYLIAESKYEFDSKGEPIRLFGIQQDITERKLTKIALEKSEEKYRALFNLSPIPMWVYDLETLQFLDVNQAAIKHYGYSREEFLSMDLKDIRLPEDVPNLEQTIANAVQKGGFLHDVVRHVKKNGEVIHVEVLGNPIELNQNKARIIVAADISEQEKHVQAIEMQNKKLREISWLQSHKVRAPLARIMGLVNLINCGSEDAETNGTLLGHIQNSARELDLIIREIVEKAEQVNQNPPG